MPIEVRQIMLARTMNLHPLEAVVLNAIINKCKDKHKFVTDCFDNEKFQHDVKKLCTDIAIEEFSSKENVEVAHV